MDYGFNKIADREELWQSLCTRDGSTSVPWLWCGDFNSITGPNDRIGSEVQLAEIRPFQQCISRCHMGEMMPTSAYYIWINKQGLDHRVWSRIDRVMHNDEWLLHFPSSRAKFLPEGLFDHCPCVITLEEDPSLDRSSFKYFNMWGHAAQFKDIVAEVWRTPMHGLTVFQVIKKLKLLKLPLKQINRGQFADIEIMAQKALATLQEKQILLHRNPSDRVLLQEENEASV
ncbi:hypothetical protein vseg_007869 [Gypsophila vaccaria]